MKAFVEDIINDHRKSFLCLLAGQLMMFALMTFVWFKVASVKEETVPEKIIVEKIQYVQGTDVEYDKTVELTDYSHPHTADKENGIFEGNVTFLDNSSSSGKIATCYFQGHRYVLFWNEGMGVGITLHPDSITSKKEDKDDNPFE